jgi:FixJ family two-component response regulator
VTTPAREPDKALTSLSDREIEVVQEIARGRTSLEIGAELFISLTGRGDWVFLIRRFHAPLSRQSHLVASAR